MMFKFSFLFFLITSIYSQNIQLKKETSYLSISDKFSYFEDKNSSLEIDSILKNEISFLKNLKKNISFGFTKSTYWFQSEIDSEVEVSDFLIEIKFPILDEIEIYYFDKKNNLKKIKLGRDKAFSERLIQHRNFLIPMDDFSNQTKILIKLKTESSLVLPISIYEKKFFFENDQYYLGIQFVFMGIIFGMASFNFLLGISLREKIYFYYVFYILVSCLFLLGLSGLNYQFFWSNYPWWNKKSSPFFLALVSFGILIFCKNFLNIKSNFKKLNLVFLIFIYFALFLSFSSLIIPYIWTGRIGILLMVTSSILVILTSVFLIKKNYRPAKFYLAGWTVFLFGSILLAFARFGLLELNFFTENFPELGLALESILFSYALADKIKILQKEKKEIEIANLLREQERIKLKSELELARRIQQSIIPRLIPVLDGYKIGALYKPMETVGGDYYDFRIINGNLGFIISDVSGHGVPAALIVSSLKTAFWFQSETFEKPDLLLKSMNQILEDKIGSEFITSAYTFLDTKSSMLKTSNAGHHPLVIYRKKTQEIFKLQPYGRPLGISFKKDFEVENFELQTNDRILIYTDGLIEVANDREEEFGEERLFNLLKQNPNLSPEILTKTLFETAKNWLDKSKTLQDDIAIIVIDKL